MARATRRMIEQLDPFSLPQQDQNALTSHPALSKQRLRLDSCPHADPRAMKITGRRAAKVGDKNKGKETSP